MYIEPITYAEIIENPDAFQQLPRSIANKLSGFPIPIIEVHHSIAEAGAIYTEFLRCIR